MMIRRFALLMSLLAILQLAFLQPAAFAEGAAPADATPHDAAQSTGTLTMREDPVLTLGDLRDLGLCIIQIREQAKNIFMEVTRRPVPASAEPEIPDLKMIAADKTELKGKFDPVRPEWITYYVGTMEPIIRLWKVNIEKTRSGALKLLVPEQDAKEFGQLVKSYDSSVEEMNTLINNIYDHVGDEGANVAIAQEAAKLYEVAVRLEDTRRRAFRLIKKAKQNGQLKEVIIPSEGTPAAAK